MKKLIALFAVLAFVASVNAQINATVTSNDAGNLYKSAPSDVTILNLQDGTVSGVDSIGADSANYYGPVSLTNGAGNPMYAGFQLWFEDGLASGDSVQTAYQLVPSNSINDTIASWTALDTVIATGDLSSYVDLTSLIAKAIVFRILNIDATESQIPDQIYFMGKKNATFYER